MDFGSTRTKAVPNKEGIAVACTVEELIDMTLRIEGIEGESTPIL